MFRPSILLDPGGVWILKGMTHDKIPKLKKVWWSKKAGLLQVCRSGKYHDHFMLTQNSNDGYIINKHIQKQMTCLWTSSLEVSNIWVS